MQKAKSSVPDFPVGLVGTYQTVAVLQVLDSLNQRLTTGPGLIVSPQRTPADERSVAARWVIYVESIVPS